MEGKRLLSICRLRLDVVLYSGPYLGDKEIIEAVKDKLRVCLSLVLEYRI